MNLFSKTTLHSRIYSGGDLDSSFPWVREVTVSNETKVYFRWGTREDEVTSAEWQVTDSPEGFKNGFSIVASGKRTETAASGQLSEFAIDLKLFLPPTPPAKPKNYYVRIVPLKGRMKFVPSLAVKVTHTKPGPQPVLKDFSFNRFEQNLNSWLAGKSMGYAYAIYEHDVLKKAGGGGVAVWPDVPHSPDRRTTMLSISKTITAAAVMKAMEQMRARGRSISINSPIAPYLPLNWHKGENVDRMTFKHLLTHTSGLRPVCTADEDTTDADSYKNLRHTIFNGASNDNFGQSSYANANFCLFRIIIPHMNSKSFEMNMSATNSDFIARHTGVTYVTYVQKHILEPIGLNSVTVIPTGPAPYTRYYKFNSPLVCFTDPVDDTAVLRTGAGYWHMSVKEFGKFISGLRHSNKIISDESFKLMRDHQLGMDGEDSEHGMYWYHNGRSGDGNGGAGTVTGWMIFTNGVTAVITVNSHGGFVERPHEVIRNAFNEAW